MRFSFKDTTVVAEEGTKIRGVQTFTLMFFRDGIGFRTEYVTLLDPPINPADREKLLIEAIRRIDEREGKNVMPL